MILNLKMTRLLSYNHIVRVLVVDWVEVPNGVLQALKVVTCLTTTLKIKASSCIM